MIIFDIGGVAVKGSLRSFYSLLARKIGIDEQDLLHAKSHYIDDAIIGKISAEDMMRRMALALGLEQEFLRQKWEDAFCETITIDDDVADIIKRLRQEHRVVALTNVIELDTQICKERGDYALFDQVFTSWELGHAKPGHKIYHEVLHRLGVDPGDCIFIDDAQENVDAAVAVGMRGIHFMNATQLRTDLKMLGAL
jgi:glucose-1-phosphatase